MNGNEIKISNSSSYLGCVDTFFFVLLILLLLNFTEINSYFHLLGIESGQKVCKLYKGGNACDYKHLKTSKQQAWSGDK